MVSLSKLVVYVRTGHREFLSGILDYAFTQFTMEGGETCAIVTDFPLDRNPYEYLLLVKRSGYLDKRKDVARLLKALPKFFRWDEGAYAAQLPVTHIACRDHQIWSHVVCIRIVHWSPKFIPEIEKCDGVHFVIGQCRLLMKNFLNFD